MSFSRSVTMNWHDDQCQDWKSQQRNHWQTNPAPEDQIPLTIKCRSHHHKRPRALCGICPETAETATIGVRRVRPDALGTEPPYHAHGALRPNFLAPTGEVCDFHLDCVWGKVAPCPPAASVRNR